MFLTCLLFLLENLWYTTGQWTETSHVSEQLYDIQITLWGKEKSAGCLDATEERRGKAGQND